MELRNLLRAAGAPGSSGGAVRALLRRVGARAFPARAGVVRSLYVLAACLLATGFYARVVNDHSPIKQWLVWTYLVCWGVAALFAASCFAAGHRLLLRLVGPSLPVLEHLACAFPLGVLLFQLLVFLAGLAGLLGPATFYGVPLVLLSYGAVPAARSLAGWWRHVGRPGKVFAKASPAASLAVAAGAVGVGLLWFQLLTPENVAYDARWYHLPIAEHYVAQRSIRKFAEGWFLGAYPHLASLLYTWAFLTPSTEYFAQLEVAAHVEFIVFLSTLLAIPALVRRLLPGTRLHASWAAVFLFPEILIYDSTLNLGADHVAALWSGPILLTFFRAYPALAAGPAAAFGLMLAGAVGTKYTAIVVVIGPVLALTLRGLWLAAGEARRRQGGAALRVLGRLSLAGGVALAASASHWAKNLIWYGDPVYPMLNQRLTLRPSTPDWQAPFDNWFRGGYHPPPTWAGVKETLTAIFTFGFVPNDFEAFHGRVPVFGGLFTLSLLLLPAVRPGRRLLFTYLAAHLGLFVWYSVHHFDRYLQTLLPWFVSATVATLVLAWRLSWPSRLGVWLLGGFQIVWGLDTPFIPGHAMIVSHSALKSTADLLASSFQHAYERKNAAFAQFGEVKKVVPRSGRVLVHEQHVHWGLERASVSDWQGTQGGISYVRRGTLRGVDALLRELKVTHVHWVAERSLGYDTLGSDLLFFAYVARGLEAPMSVAGAQLAPLPPQPTVVEPENYSVAYFGCGVESPYDNGLYDLAALTASSYDPTHARPAPRELFAEGDPAAREVLAQTAFAVMNKKCRPSLIEVAKATGHKVIARRPEEILMARLPAPPSASPSASPSAFPSASPSAFPFASAPSLSSAPRFGSAPPSVPPSASLSSAPRPSSAPSSAFPSAPRPSSAPSS
ncbi:MAG: hypothetical protein MUF34_36610, partial [Polyangiaceae bacterium]|nr:hypothetical protein [Polyangiaceae bacterium]